MDKNSQIVISSQDFVAYVCYNSTLFQDFEQIISMNSPDLLLATVMHHFDMMYHAASKCTPSHLSLSQNETPWWRYKISLFTRLLIYILRSNWQLYIERLYNFFLSLIYSQIQCQLRIFGNFLSNLNSFFVHMSDLQADYHFSICENISKFTIIFSNHLFLP